MADTSSRRRHINYLLGGLVTVVPLAVTVIVFQFVFNVLSDAGAPWVRWLIRSFVRDGTQLAQWLERLWFQELLSVLIVLLALYVLGFATNRVLGRRIVALLESLLHRLPVIQYIYGSVKRLIDVLRQQPRDVKRVVLINFPSREMKTVGLVTQTLTDADTGETLVAVYVPTTPNPTSGYLEIVPLSRVTPTDWSLDDAMTFVISGGAVAPAEVRYHGRPEDKLSVDPDPEPDSDSGSKGEGGPASGNSPGP